MPTDSGMDKLLVIYLFLLSQSVWVAVTKHHKLGGLNNYHLFLTILESEKSKSKLLIDLVSGGGEDPRFVDGCLVLMSLHDLPLCMHEERDYLLSSLFFYV